MDLFNQTLYHPKNQSVLRLLYDFENKYNPIFTKVKTQWLPNIREFLREETGLRMHQKVVGVRMLKDTNVGFNFVPDRENIFVQLIDEHYPDLDFEEYVSFNALHRQLKQAKKSFNKRLKIPRRPLMSY